jgi:hypothetical protein
LQIPKSIQLEHEELHKILSIAINEGGATGDAAKAVAKVLNPHFEKEEQYALPPLGLLEVVTLGKSHPEMGDVLRLTDKLKAEMSQMVQEHKAIVRELNDLFKAAIKEKKPEYVHFAEKLTLHAQTEEEIFYPAAILIGEHLKLKR